VGTERVELAEFRLTMGCPDDAPACIAQGGQSLGANSMVYGYLRDAGRQSYRVELFALDVGGKSIVAQTTTTIARTAITSDAIQQTADELIAELFPSDSTVPAPVPGEKAGPSTSPNTPPAGRAPSDRGAPRGNLVWGVYKPVPAWKKAGLGVSVSLFVASLATAAGLSYAISKKGPLRKELIKAAEDSLTDTLPTGELNTRNDVDPNSNVDLCQVARMEGTDNGVPQPGTVKNAKVAKICNRADGMEIGANISWGIAVASGISTVVFTTLMFVHREKPQVAKLRQRGLHVGISPIRSGFTVGGGMRF
jgi:hypothetical protein